MPGRIANALTWGLWWPSLMLLFLFIGRIWCTICPLSTGARATGRVWSAKRPPPEWIKEHAGWIAAFLLLLIVWSEQAFRMTHNPRATAGLLLSLMGTAVVFRLLYQREVWCRYLCPLGSLAASYSVSASTHIGASQAVCATQCKSHECFKGTDKIEGCPVFLHPLYVRDGHFCKLCLTCLRSCPHGSAKLYLRVPLRSLWYLSDLSTALLPVGLLAFLLSLAMLASAVVPFAHTRLGFSGLVVVSVAATIGLNFALPRQLSPDEEPDPVLAARIGFALVLLSWGPFMAYHLTNVPGLKAIRLFVSDPIPPIARLVGTGIPVLPVLQCGTILLAAVCSGICVLRVLTRHIDSVGKEHVPKVAWGLLLGAWSVYVLTAGWLVIQGGGRPRGTESKELTGERPSLPW